ncbi:putative integrase/recombinase [Rhodococcus wratislaviensis IFP 2016]|nr:putative integrase/recombinase [Rhodococcus wratislaviensis IFP 2016]
MAARCAGSRPAPRRRLAAAAVDRPCRPCPARRAHRIASPPRRESTPLPHRREGRDGQGGSTPHNRAVQQIWFDRSCPAALRRRTPPPPWAAYAGVDISTIALWLGHSDTKATQAYLHADLALKEKALARTAPPTVGRGRYRPPDPILDFLEHL